ncbi:hypothetical protein BO224_11955 [Erysipelotrichaceae bacterium NYU-BL-E8]|uniref:Uncharacterized protein n=1 Tax=Ileibacterium valens TaxID=1862668 RepID=A0A1U7NCN1_9FIRM|nr:hypothetical protein BO222_12560 [Ileibacterium valens]OLU36645.1 hypothetical protein BO224_11955 [Erysipelotrichaceae bacterium NYU-BL-E8]OLU36923.1 hypothetical protein BM735_11585 [Erysipelotrichaceae bacterium NYU-BL-F16]
MAQPRDTNPIFILLFLLKLIFGVKAFNIYSTDFYFKFLLIYHPRKLMMNIIPTFQIFKLQIIFIWI